MSMRAELPPTAAIGEGIYQIRLPMVGNPLRYINGYLVEEPDGLTLVDTGWKTDDVLAAVHAGLAAFGFVLGDVRRLAITHSHFDHYGLAATLQREGVPELMMHRLDWERAQSFFEDPVARDRQADVWIERNGYTLDEPDDADENHRRRSELAPPTRTVDDGAFIGRLETIWTPGHTVGHICFRDSRSGKMLVGDHILDPITPHVGFWNENRGDPLGDYVASLRKVARVGATGVLPAHGEPFPDLQRRLDEILDHTARREQQVVDLLASGEPVTAAQVARGLPWTRRNRSFDELSPLHRQFAVSETIAHLEHLRVEDRIGRRATDERIDYVRS